MKLHFLHGTETGNSEMVCEDIEAELGAGFDCTIDSLSDMSPADLHAETFYIFVTSTYGSGDLPATAQPFASALDDEKPDLSHVRFAIFGLGDLIFEDTFAHGSETLMTKLVQCNARMIGQRGIHDASGTDMPEDIAIPWAHGILALLNEEAA